MTAEIHYLSGNTKAVEQFIRIGHTGHCQLDTLCQSGKASVDHAVFNAAHIETQKALVDTLYNASTDIVLDTNVAELSSHGTFDGSVSSAPWSNSKRPLNPSDFQGTKKGAIIHQIAEFAVSHNIDSVLSPSHLLDPSRDEWSKIDFQSCELLRESLDKTGGKNISLDYQLIIPSSMLMDTAHRLSLIKELKELPFDNLWIKVSGFGANARPSAIRKMIMNLADFHAIEDKAIIADCVGGLTSLALIAFGASSAVSHGVAQREQFDSYSWRVRSKNNRRGGQTKRIYFPGLDRYFKTSEVDSIMKARGARLLLSCQDRECCPLGYDDMLKNPNAHFMKQRRKQILDLENTHQDRRVNRFLDYHLTSADRVSRKASQLKIESEPIIAALQKNSERLDSMRSVLEDLHLTIGDELSTSPTVKIRKSVQTRKIIN